MNCARPRPTPRRAPRGLVLARLAVLALPLLVSACAPSRLIARMMVSAPNRAPQFIQPAPRVTLRWEAGLLERFPAATNTVGTPPVHLLWMKVDAAEYGLRLTSESDQRGDRTLGDVKLTVQLPAHGLPAPKPALGTAFLVHGYGVDLETLFPLALDLAQAGWRCLLVDLRGHGLSDGDRVTFGIQEARDLQELRDQLETAGQVHAPYVAVGHSLGGAIALRWQAADPRIQASVAIGSPAHFVPAVERVRAAYASWVPRGWVRRAAQRVPGLLNVPAEQLDTTWALHTRPLLGLVVSSSADAVAPPEDGASLMAGLGAGSRLLIVDGLSHELLPYGVDQYGAGLRAWLREAVNVTSFRPGRWR